MSDSLIKVNSIVGSGGNNPVNISLGASCPAGSTFQALGNVTISGVLTATTFVGDGSQLTNLSFAQIGQVIGFMYLQ